MTAYPTPRPRRHLWPLLLLAAVLLVGAGGTIAGYALTRDDTATPAAATAPAASAADTAEELRVADLMARLDCEGAVIGTQLYSQETGRCKMADGAEVTIAVFDTADLRDQWIEAGRQFGGNLVAGDGWAAGAERPDTAGAVAKKLDGKRV